ncbi:MAG: MBL fold metallo-hydrolase [Clostridiales bacterium]|nr:MBL fold metallo-hydrolase [Clostridiales bacterium]MBQ3046996.1 MBL fold metallo-hydrolase [Clostridia bacterium]
MKLYSLVNGPLRVNTYFLVNDSGDAIVIDSGENYNKVKQTEKDLNVKIKAVLLTHAHFDHAGNAKKLQDDGAKIYISSIDAPKLKNELNLSSHFGRKFEFLDADVTFMDGDELDILGIKIKVLLTPGHTDGSATFIVDNMLFTGDTLFLESVGRTDFPTGNRRELRNSVKKLFDLSGDYSVYPGHEDFTTLDHEREFNTFVDYD